MDKQRIWEKQDRNIIIVTKKYTTEHYLYLALLKFKDFEEVIFKTVDVNNNRLEQIIELLQNVPVYVRERNKEPHNTLGEINIIYVKKHSVI